METQSQKRQDAQIALALAKAGGAGGAVGKVQALRFTLTLAQIQAAGASQQVTVQGPTFPAGAVLLGAYADVSSPVQNAGSTATNAGPSALVINNLGAVIGQLDVTQNPGGAGVVPGLSANTPGSYSFGAFVGAPVGGQQTVIQITLSVPLNTITTGQVPCVFYYAIVP